MNIFNLHGIHADSDHRIVHVQLNHTVHEELMDHPEYVAKLRTILKSNLINSGMSFVEVHKNSNHIWLEKLADFGYQLAVVWFDGSWPLGSDFDTELLRLYDTEWSQHSWMLAGHILNRPGNYPKWHHQCVVVNLTAWKQEGCPPPNRFGKKLKSGFRASSECIHDDYTPCVLYPDKAMHSECQGLSHSDDYFNAFIHQALGSGYQVLNLPHSVRQHKCCIYPEDDVEQTISWLLDTEYLQNYSTSQVREFGYNLNPDKMELYGYKAQNVQVLYVTNTESVPAAPPIAGITKIAVPCSGLHQFWHIVHALDTLQQVVWFDFNPYAVEWTKLVLAEWDGRNFAGFVQQNIQRIIGDGVISPDCVLFDPELAAEFIRRVGGEDAWTALFERIKQLDHQFSVTDIVRDWQVLADRIGSGHRVLLQVSNIWQYESNYLNTMPFQAQLAFISLIQTVSQNNQDLYFTGDTPGGVHYVYQNIKELTGIF
jgi:hypothetical protein